MAKGSGMIHPNMATMLAAITTDAAVSPGLWRDILRRGAANSFNQASQGQQLQTRLAVHAGHQLHAGSMRDSSSMRQGTRRPAVTGMQAAPAWQTGRGHILAGGRRQPCSASQACSAHKSSAAGSACLALSGKHQLPTLSRQARLNPVSPRLCDRSPWTGTPAPMTPFWGWPAAPQATTPSAMHRPKRASSSKQPSLPSYRCDPGCCVVAHIILVLYVADAQAMPASGCRLVRAVGISPLHHVQLRGHCGACMAACSPMKIPAIEPGMQGLAKSIAWDGEGATCLLEVHVTGTGCTWTHVPMSGFMQHGMEPLPCR